MVDGDSPTGRHYARRSVRSVENAVRLVTARRTGS